jgi:hypothetical protein
MKDRRYTPSKSRICVDFRLPLVERAQDTIHSLLPPLPTSPTASDAGAAEPSYVVPSVPPVEEKTPPISKAPPKPIRKGGPKPKLSAKEKKARDVRKSPEILPNVQVYIVTSFFLLPSTDVGGEITQSRSSGVPWT